MGEPLLYDREHQLARIDRFIKLTSHYTKKQLHLLEYSKVFASKLGQAQMDRLVTKTIDENVTTLSIALKDLSDSQIVSVRHPENDTSAIMQGLGYSTESYCYHALVNNGEDTWPLLTGSQLSLHAKPDGAQQNSLVYALWQRSTYSSAIPDPVKRP